MDRTDKKSALIGLSILVVSGAVLALLVFTWESANDTYNRSCIYTLNPAKDCSALGASVNALNYEVALGVVAFLFVVYVVVAWVLKAGRVLEHRQATNIRGRLR